jgi:hypothetical protein
MPRAFQFGNILLRSRIFKVTFCKGRVASGLRRYIYFHPFAAELSGVLGELMSCVLLAVWNRKNGLI